MNPVRSCPSRLRVATWFLLSCVAGLATGCGVAAADEQKPYGPGRGPASASAAVSVSALPAKDIAPPPSSARGAWQPDFAAAPVPEQPSPAPDKAEWAAAPIASEARVTYERCSVRRIREWYRVTCQYQRAAEMITGKSEGVTFNCMNVTPDGFGGCDELSIVFPARRGDSRGFELFVTTRWSPIADAIVSEQFIDGDALPLISVQGIRWGF